MSELSNVRIIKPGLLLGKQRKFNEFLTQEELNNLLEKNPNAYTSMINQQRLEVVDKSGVGKAMDANQFSVLRDKIESLEAKLSQLEALIQNRNDTLHITVNSEELDLSNFKKGDSFKFKGAVESEVLSGVAMKVSPKYKTAETEVDGVEWSVPFEDILEV